MERARIGRLVIGLAAAVTLAACSGSELAPTPLPSAATGISGTGRPVALADRRLKDLNSPNECPMDAPSILVSMGGVPGARHVDVEFAQSNRSTQIRFTVQRWEDTDDSGHQMQRPRSAARWVDVATVRELIAKGHAEVKLPGDGKGTYRVFDARYELSALCGGGLSNAAPPMTVSGE
jgi:hypothetical protein